MQQQWLTHELATAPEDKALIVAVHHPIYSFDDHHSGSPRMADFLQHAINDTRRVPNLVLTAHVHNYQRIEKTLIDGTPSPFLVAGHGGYYHLHGLSAGADTTDPDTQATLIFAEDKAHGYVTLTIDPDTIAGTMTTAQWNQPIVPEVDTFSYTAKALHLAEGQVVSL